MNKRSKNERIEISMKKKVMIKKEEEEERS